MTKKKADVAPEDRCKKCPHTLDQHDEDGFCTVEDGVLGYCKCTAGELEGTDPPEGTESVDDS